MTHLEKTYLSDREVAERLSLGLSTTRRLMSVIPNARVKIGRAVRNNWAVVKEYLEQNETINIR